jgi:hypothetical protein
MVEKAIKKVEDQTKKYMGTVPKYLQKFKAQERLE